MNTFFLYVYLPDCHCVELDWSFNGHKCHIAVKKKKWSHNFSCNYGSLLVIKGILPCNYERNWCLSVSARCNFWGKLCIFFLDTHFRENMVITRRELLFTRKAAIKQWYEINWFYFLLFYFFLPLYWPLTLPPSVAHCVVPRERHPSQAAS